MPKVSKENQKKLEDAKNKRYEKGASMWNELLEKVSGSKKKKKKKEDDSPRRRVVDPEKAKKFDLWGD